MKRRILLVDDDLAVLLTLKAVLELNGFEVETAGSSAEALARMTSGIYQMVISDLRMESEEAGLEVIRAARRQPYEPAIALLTAYPPAANRCGETRHDGEDWTGENSGSLLIKPLGTAELIRQVEALLHGQTDKGQTAKGQASKVEADKRSKQKTATAKAQPVKRHLG